jgi:HSP20 family molecular chaperone IbpA
VVERATPDAVVAATAETEAHMIPQRVPVNVYESSNALVIVAPLPAVTANDVTIELRPGVVRFWASARSAGPREYLVNEWSYGGSEPSVEIPEGYGRDLEAAVANGQLAVRVLKGQPIETAHDSPFRTLSRVWFSRSSRVCTVHAPDLPCWALALAARIADPLKVYAVPRAEMMRHWASVSVPGTRGLHGRRRGVAIRCFARW